MKFSRTNPKQCNIILNLVNCLIIFISLLFYINKVKLSYMNIIFVIILMFIINTMSLVTSIKIKKNITEYEEKLEMFEGIVETAPNAIIIHKKLKIIYANNIASKLFNLDSNSKLVGKPIEHFVNLNRDIIGLKRMESVLNEKDFEPLIEEIFLSKNGQVVELEILSTPIKIGSGVCVLNLCKNVTEKKTNNRA